MAFMEILHALYTLDFGFLIGLVMDNLFWIFGFIAAGYVFTDGKATIRNAVVYILLVICSIDLFKITGFSIYTAFGLGVLYMVRVPLLLFLDKSKTLSKHIPLAWVLSFFFTIAVVAFFG